MYGSGEDHIIPIGEYFNCEDRGPLGCSCVQCEDIDFIYDHIHQYREESTNKDPYFRSEDEYSSNVDMVPSEDEDIFNVNRASSEESTADVAERLYYNVQYPPIFEPRFNSDDDPIGKPRDNMIEDIINALKNPELIDDITDVQEEI